MPLKLSFPSRAHLWAEVVMSRGERVFVATEEKLETGSQTGLSLEAPELPTSLTCVVTVQGTRPPMTGLKGGVWVKVDEATVARLQSLLGAAAKDDEKQRIAGRTEPRVDCDFPARVTAPGPTVTANVKSISPHGLTLKADFTTAPGKVLSLSVMLPDGDAALSGTVMWVRPELKLCGLRLIGLDSITEVRLEKTVTALSVSKAEALPQTGHTVVVADDDPSILDFMTRVATKAGHRVVRTDRGDKALELVRQEKPQLVFLDVLMPGLDGLEVAKAIRQDATLTGTPVVLLSAMGEARLAEAVRSSGATDFLTKPMKLEAVRGLMARLLPVAAPKK
ncbi:MAG: response regulator [Myxococcaceae bacterium]|nr:response regulator [Myxococcaceae bacterium]